MKVFKYLLLATVAGFCFTASAPKVQAQVSVEIGVAPVCPYGYFDTAPYSCAPYGYYGPEWFNGGVFIGAGPWFHGAANFHGRVDNRFHPDHGYTGHVPERGEKADPKRPAGKVSNFKGSETRDGRGHVVSGKPHTP